MKSVETKSNASSASGGRLVSLDAFRGFDMLIIIGFDRVFSALGRCIYGGDGGWMAEQMSHPYWFGLSFYDTVFPTFLFIADISFPFSYARQREKGVSSLQIHLSILKKGLASTGETFRPDDLPGEHAQHRRSRREEIAENSARLG